MNFRIILTTFLLLNFTASFASSLTLNKSSSSTSYTCSEIQTNYMDDVYGEFRGMIITLKNEPGYKSFHHSFQNAITAAMNSFNANDYTYNTLDGLNSQLQKSKYPSSLSKFLKKLNDQKTSAHTRVSQWDSPNKNNPNSIPCRESWGCDLGQEGTHCEVQTSGQAKSM